MASDSSDAQADRSPILRPSSTEAIVGFAWMAFLPFCVYGCVMVVRLRHKYNIRGRGYAKMLAQSILGTMFFAKAIWLGIEINYCFEKLIDSYLIAILTDLTLLRIMCLVFKFRISRRLLQIGKITDSMGANTEAQTSPCMLMPSKALGTDENVPSAGSVAASDAESLNHGTTAAANTGPDHSPAARQKHSGILVGLDVGPDAWFIRNRWMITNRWQFTLFLVTALIVPAASVPIYFFNCPEAAVHAEMFRNVCAGVGGLMSVILATRMRLEDGEVFGIRAELKYLGITVLTYLILSFPLLRFGAIDQFFNDNMTLAMIAVAYSVSILWPLWVAFHTNEDAEFKALEDFHTLEDLLGYDFGYNSFLTYTTQEFAHENVLFWKAVVDWKSKYDVDDPRLQIVQRENCMIEAQAIIDQYIVEEAPSQVNLAAPIRTTLLAAWDAEKHRVAEFVSTRASLSTSSSLLSQRSSISAIGPTSQSLPPAACISPMNAIRGTQPSSVNTSRSSQNRFALSAASLSASSPVAHHHVSSISTTSTELSESTAVTSSDLIEIRSSSLAIIPERREDVDANGHARADSGTLVLTVLSAESVSSLPAAPSSDGAHSMPPVAPSSSCTADELKRAEELQTPKARVGRAPLTTLTVITLFDRAQKATYGLMSSDLLPRYLKSSDFLKFLTLFKSFVQRRKENQSVLHSKAQLYKPPTTPSRVKRAVPTSSPCDTSLDSSTLIEDLDVPSAVTTSAPRLLSTPVGARTPVGPSRSPSLSQSSPSVSRKENTVSTGAISNLTVPCPQPSLQRSGEVRLNLTLGTSGQASWVNIDDLVITKEGLRIQSSAAGIPQAIPQGKTTTR